MTEQIERELTEMFRERTVRLDVLPPLPAARVRRARLQAGLALASVVALLAGVVLAGARLAAAGGSASPMTTTATGQRAMADLAKALRKTLGSRMVATSTTVDVPSGKLTDAPDLGFSAALGRGESEKTTYDGRAGVAFGAGPDGFSSQLFVDGVLYVRKDPKNDSFLPPTVFWIRYDRNPSESAAEWRRDGIARTIPGLNQLYSMPPVSVEERAGRIRLSGPDMAGMRAVTVVQLDGSGVIKSVTSRWVLTMANAASDRVDRVTFRPLHAAMPDVTAPPPANVISSSDYDAAKGTHDAQANCPAPASSTAPDGTTVTTQVDCLPPPAGATPEPTPTPTPS